MGAVLENRLRYTLRTRINRDRGFGVAIGLMGFGRIGRNVFRQLSVEDRMRVGAIVDIAAPEALAHLLKYDSIYGPFPEPVSLDNGVLRVGDRRIPLIHAVEPGEVDWRALGVETVVQATGKYRTSEWCARHLDAGAARVILASTTEQPGDLPLLLSGVTDRVLAEDPAMVAMGSNTSNAMAPLVEVLDRHFGIEEMFFTTIHAYTNRARLGDVPTGGYRSSRAAGENIIPASSNTADILEGVFPHLAGRLSSKALNVPVDDGSTVDAVTRLAASTNAREVNEVVRRACRTDYLGILGFTDDPIVSSDVRSSPYSGVLDSLSTMVIGGSLLKTIEWFDTGWGYAARIVELLDRYYPEGIRW